MPRQNNIATAVLVFLLFCGNAAADTAFKYYNRGQRDPFIPLVTSGAKQSLGVEAVEGIEDVILEGIVYDPNGMSLAMINGDVLKEGDKTFNMQVVKIYDKSVVIKIYDEPYTVGLVEEGGEKIDKQD